MDVVALLHPGIKQLSVARREREWRPLPNTHKAVLDNLYRAEYLEHLNISGMRGLDHTSVKSQHNDLIMTSQARDLITS